MEIRGVFQTFKIKKMGNKGSANCAAFAEWHKSCFGYLPRFFFSPSSGEGRYKIGETRIEFEMVGENFAVCYFNQPENYPFAVLTLQGMLVLAYGILAQAEADFERDY